jgi:hypothetical protein
MNAFARRVVYHIDRYVELRRSLGHAFDVQAATLRAFGRFVEQRAELGPLTQQLVLTFVLACPVTPRVRTKRYGVLRTSQTTLRSSSLEQRRWTHGRCRRLGRVLRSAFPPMMNSHGFCERLGSFHRVIRYVASRCTPRSA